MYADDTPLTSESSSAELAKLAVEDYCVRDIDAWMTVNKLKMNRDKTELVVLNASHRQPSPLTSISVCDEVISKSSVATILVTNLETLVCVSPSPVLIWVLQLSQCCQHWGRRWALFLSENKCVKSECKKFKRKFKETVSVSTICDEYCRNIGVLCDTFMSMKYLVAVSRMQGKPLPPSPMAAFEILAA